MGITGARWSLPGAQAVLWLRAIRASGDTDQLLDLPPPPGTPAQPPQPLPRQQPRARRLNLTPKEPHPCHNAGRSGSGGPSDAATAALERQQCHNAGPREARVTPPRPASYYQTPPIPAIILLDAETLLQVNLAAEISVTTLPGNSGRINAAWRRYYLGGLMKLSFRLLIIVAVTTAALTGAGAALAATHHPAGPRTAVARVFQANSASFLSASTGFVLGGVHCKPGHSCAAILASTTDGGTRWRLAPVHGVTLDAAGQVLFVTRRIGWIYGTSQLWATRDGGRTWQRRQPGMGALAMAVAGPRVYAELSPDRGSKQPGGLYTSPVSHSSWALAPGVTGPSGVLASHGDTVWFASVPDQSSGPTFIFTRTADGPWHKKAFACPGKEYMLSSIAVASRADIAYLCTSTADFDMTDEGMRVLVSANGGRTAHLAGHWVPAISGSGGVLAMAPGNAHMITFATPPNAIGTFGRSVNGGRTWHVIKGFGLGTWNSLAYVSPTTGYVVVALAGAAPPGELLRTTNAGRTWKPVHLPAAG